MPLEPSRERRSWTAREDQLLREAVEREDPHNPNPSKWHAIAKHVPNRTNKDCRKRWFAKMASDVVKGGWSPEEDERLMKGIKVFGTRWSQVASIVQTRNSDQCAKRWTDTLNPSIDRSMWTSEADRVLVAAVAEHGKVWTKIVKTYFPGRTGLSAKNRYNSITRYNSDPSRCRARRRSPEGAKQFMRSKLRPVSPASLLASPASSSCTTPSPITTPITLFTVADASSCQPNMVDAFSGWQPFTSAPADSLFDANFLVNASSNHIPGRQSLPVRPRMVDPSFRSVDRTMNQTFPQYANTSVALIPNVQAQTSIYTAGSQNSQQFCSLTNGPHNQLAAAEPYQAEIDQLMSFSWDSADLIPETKPCRLAMPIAGKNSFIF